MNFGPPKQVLHSASRPVTFPHLPQRCMLRAPLAVAGRRCISSMAAAAAGRQVFSGGSAVELADWLRSGGIDVSAYGRASAKSLEQLWDEVQAGETQLFLEEGKPMREVAVLNVFITNGKGQTLIEAEQVLPNGSRRTRDLPLSEKLLPGERWQEAVVRGIVEELGPVLPSEPQVEVDEGSYQESVETKESQSYPGLVSKYVCKRVKAQVLGGVLPEQDFVTDEERSDGMLQHCWVWR